GGGVGVELLPIPGDFDTATAHLARDGPCSHRCTLEEAATARQAKEGEGHEREEEATQSALSGHIISSLSFDDQKHFDILPHPNNESTAALSSARARPDPRPPPPTPQNHFT